MRVSLYAIGKLKKGPEVELYDRFDQRITTTGKLLGMGPVSLVEISESRALSAKLRREDEAQKLLSKFPADGHIIALDESGKSLSSVSFANYIRKIRDQGVADLVFTIGGPDGHGPLITTSSHLRLSLSSMTLTHGFARIILIEQLYRAFTILSGHPYHRN